MMNAAWEGRLALQACVLLHPQRRILGEVQLAQVVTVLIESAKVRGSHPSPVVQIT